MTTTLIRTPEAKARLQATLDHLEAHPEEWNQAAWRCETGKCLFGTYVDIHPDLEWDNTGVVLFMPNVRHVRGVSYIRDAVRADLGLTAQESTDLAHCDNTMDDLRRMVGEYVNDQPLTTFVEHYDDFDYYRVEAILTGESL